MKIAVVAVSPVAFEDARRALIAAGHVDMIVQCDWAPETTNEVLHLGGPIALGRMPDKIEVQPGAWAERSEVRDPDQLLEMLRNAVARAQFAERLLIKSAEQLQCEEQESAVNRGDLKALIAELFSHPAVHDALVPPAVAVKQGRVQRPEWIESNRLHLDEPGLDGGKFNQPAEGTVIDP